MTTIHERLAGMHPTIVWTSECGRRSFETPVPSGYTPTEWAEKEEVLRDSCWTNDEYLEVRRIFLATAPRKKVS